jgi:hypothetical protein
LKDLIYCPERASARKGSKVDGNAPGHNSISGTESALLLPNWDIARFVRLFGRKEQNNEAGKVTVVNATLHYFWDLRVEDERRTRYGRPWKLTGHGPFPRADFVSFRWDDRWYQHKPPKVQFVGNLTHGRPEKRDVDGSLWPDENEVTAVPGSWFHSLTKSSKDNPQS